VELEPEPNVEETAGQDGFCSASTSVHAADRQETGGRGGDRLSP